MLDGLFLSGRSGDFNPDAAQEAEELQMPTGVKSKNLAEVLLHEGLISPEQYEKGVEQSEKSDAPFSRVFLEMGAITEGVKIGVLQKRFDCKLVSLKNAELSPETASILPIRLCEKHRLAPIKVDESSILVAMEDPTDVRAIDAVEKASGKSVRPLLAKAAEISDVRERLAQAAPVAAAAKGRPAMAVLSVITLPLLIIAPIIVFWGLLFTNPSLQTIVLSELTLFDQVLYFVLTVCLWASLVYWLDELLFDSYRQSKRKAAMETPGTDEA